MKYAHKCEACRRIDIKEVPFTVWLKIKLNTIEPTCCDECSKALLKIGLARFSDIDIELEQQKERWIAHRELLMKEVN